MDIRMTKMSGIETTEKIKAMAPELKIIMLSAVDDDQTLLEAIRVGADGFISKDTPGKRLVEMVEDAVSGLAPLSPKFASRVLMELREPKNNELKSMGRLTPRELAVLTGVVKGGTNKQIAGTLNVSESTVKHHLSNVLAKFHLSNRAEAAAYAMRQGLVQEEADR